MNIRTLIVALSAVLLLAVNTSAKDIPNFEFNKKVVRSDGSSVAKAAGDTILLIGPTGSGAPVIGDFEAGWNGWTSVDPTQPTVHFWQTSDYNQVVPGNLAAWCGDLGLMPCDVDDPVGGYGNSWHEILATSVVVSDPGSMATVRVTATLQIDSEPAYDYVYLTAHNGLTSNYTNIFSWDGTGTHQVDVSYSVAPGEFVSGNKAMVSFRFRSDGGWSDADCSYASSGACQVDDITVTVSQSGHPDLVTFTDFQDGSFGAWAPIFPSGVGNFAKLWRGLRDADPCAENTSQQVAFIDDGVVVPGTGGSQCLNWCYGTGGFIVNTTGGLIEPAGSLHNMVWSPVMAWPDDNMDGALLSYDVYDHEELDADAPGVFDVWNVWSVNNEQPDGWLDFHYYVSGSSPRYKRVRQSVGDWLYSGRDSVRVAVGVYELGWAWGWNGNDGYPAPYFDNIRFEVYETYGPLMKAWDIELAQDNFPETDAINLNDPGSMHVRFDMANNIAPEEHMRNDPGDSIIVTILPQRTGATLVGPPQMHYVIDANPVFDAYRTVAPGGMVTGVPAARGSEYTSSSEWAFDLPDSSTLFPGDILHYYIRAGDEVGGVVQYNTLPANIDGYGVLGDRMGYDTRFVVHALPTIKEDGGNPYQANTVLVWLDGVSAESKNHWFQGMPGFPGDYADVYRTRDPDNGRGNGLGGRTSGGSLAYYDHIVYASGERSQNTLSNGSYTEDAGDDLAVMASWLDAGNRDLFLSGDNLAADLALNQGVAGVDFLQQVMGVDFVASDLRPLVNNQTAPLVWVVSGSPIFRNIDQWYVYGACPEFKSFDAVTARAGAARLAEFTDPAGLPGAYPFTAATLNLTGNGNCVVSLPYDWSAIHTATGAKVSAPLSARSLVMMDILDWFGAPLVEYTHVPEREAFAVSFYPNPFNPVTRLNYVIKAPGHLSLKVYNVRGQFVRTLLDEDVQASGHVMWDGTDRAGAAVASGVYFSEARMGDEVRVGKMMLIK